MSAQSSIHADLRFVDDETQGMVLDLLFDVMECVRAREVTELVVSYDRELYETGEDPFAKTWAVGLETGLLSVDVRGIRR